MATLERPVPEITHERSLFYDEPQFLYAAIDGNPVGSIEYTRNFESGGWTLDSILVRDQKRGRGIGKALVKAFVKEIGTDQPVDAFIQHETTHQAIVNKYAVGLLPDETRDLPLEDLSSLAWVRWFKSCGIETTNISVTMNPIEFGETTYAIVYEGVTLPNP